MLTAAGRFHLRRAPPENRRPRRAWDSACPRGSSSPKWAKRCSLGALLMMPAVLTMLALDLRQLKPGVAPACVGGLTLIVGGLLTGLAVALIEETFLRGAMLTAIKRESGAVSRIVLTALVYAATHFFGRYRVAAGRRECRQRYRHAGRHPRSVRAAARTSSMRSCASRGRRVVRHGARAHRQHRRRIGLHAGWVAVIYVVRETPTARPDARAWMLGEFDGFIGWLVLAWTLVLGISLCWWYRPEWAARAGSDPAQPDSARFHSLGAPQLSRLLRRSIGSSSSSNACLSASSMGSSSATRAPIQAASSNFRATFS